MFKVDQREFKAEMQELLDGVDLKRPSFSLETFREAVLVLIKHHKIVIKEDVFVGQLVKLLMAHNKVRAKKLVSHLPDESLTNAGSLLILGGVGAIALGLLGAFVWFVVWLAK